MIEANVQSATEVTLGLSQWQRVTNIFSAPSKTFEDIKRGNKSWWLPLIIVAVASYIFFAAVATQIGLPQVVENQIRLDPKAEQRMAQIPPAQREMTNKVALYSVEGTFIASPLLSIAGVAVLSLVLLGTINFGFGGKAKFGSVFTVWMYASLPSVIKTLLGTLVIFAGTSPDAFNIKNPAPTNIGAFLNPLETNKVLYTLATSLDAVAIWTMVLLAIGIATVAGVKRSSGYIAVFGWWVLMVLVITGFAAAFS